MRLGSVLIAVALLAGSVGAEAQPRSASDRYRQSQQEAAKKAAAKKEAAKEEAAKEAAKKEAAQKAAAQKAKQKPAPKPAAAPKAAAPAAAAAAAPAAEPAAAETADTAAPAESEEAEGQAKVSKANFDAPLPTMPGPKLTPAEIEGAIRSCQAKKPPRKSKSALTESTYRQMERIQTGIGKGEYAEAEKKLGEMLERANQEYEKAVIVQTLAFVYAQQNKMDKAIGAFRKALETNALPQAAHEQLMYNIGQILLAEDKVDQSIKQLEAYMDEACNPVPDAHVILAAAYAEKKRFKDSMHHVDLALAKAKSPKESWLQLKLALHYEMKDMVGCAGVLLQLVSVAPAKEQYWKQLSSLYFEIGKDPAALAALAIADQKGFITEEGEFKNLANLYFYLQIPYKAGQVIQRGLSEKALPEDEKNLELLANAWVMAREDAKAEAALKKAAAVSGKGELWKRLAHVYVEQEDWKAAAAALDQAQAKGGVKHEGEMNMLIGVAATQLKDYKKAEVALREALKDEKVRKQASDWLNHVFELRQAEETQAAALAEAKRLAEEKEAELQAN